MGLEWLRDLVICILGLVAAGVLIFIAVLAYSFYHRTKPILDSVNAVVTTIQEVVISVEEIARPIMQVVAVIRGVRQGVDAVSKLFDKRRKRRNG